MGISRNLKKEIFQGLFHLQELDLSANRLTAIADEAFAHLHKLESLRLPENRLTYVHPHWWRPLKSLYALDLKLNAFSLIQPAAFESLGATLRTLDLAENRLFHVNPTGFAALSRLEYLDLQGNSLNSVPVGLSSLKSLRSLNLSRNPIGRIRRLDFADISTLRDIALIAMVRLQIVEPQAFTRLPHLIVVAMHDNPRLAFVDPAAFDDCPALTHLLLHNNNLATLDERLLAGLPALESISYYRNPLRCDCGLVWLGERLRNPSDKLEFQEAAHMVCDAPDEHKFKVLMQLRPEELQTVDCQPRIFPLFDAELQRKIGDDLILDCVAGGGRSPPRTYWITPDESAVAGATLALTHIRVEQAGRYALILFLINQLKFAIH